MKNKIKINSSAKHIPKLYNQWDLSYFLDWSQNNQKGLQNRKSELGIFAFKKRRKMWEGSLLLFKNDVLLVKQCGRLTLTGCQVATKLFYLSTSLLDRGEKIRLKSDSQVEIQFSIAVAKVWVQTQNQRGLLSPSHHQAILSFFLGSRASAHIDIAVGHLRFSVCVWNGLSVSCKSSLPAYLHTSRTCQCSAPLRDHSKALQVFSTVLFTH